MSDYGIYDKHVKKIIALNKKRGTYFPVQQPKPEEKLNPLSDFWRNKDGNQVPEGEARITKMAIFSVDEAMGEKALAENGTTIKLGAPGAKLENVDRVSGIWRIQTDFPYEITQVRDKQMVLLKKLDHVEKTLFEFWTAKMVGYNCYGPFVTTDKGYDYIVAVYDTDNGKLVGYGKTIEAARAFLGLKLYDEYKDVINNIACRNKLKNKQK